MPQTKKSHEKSPEKKPKKKSRSSSRSSSKSKSLPVDIIIDLLNETFGSDYRIEKTQVSSKIFLIFLEDLRCMEFSIHFRRTPEIQIDYLDNCKSELSESRKGTGTNTMQLIIQFARNMRRIEGFEETQLLVKTDASRLKFNIEGKEKTLPLHTLFTLTRGETWYNSLGFYERGYEINRELAERYINSEIPTMQPAKRISDLLRCKKGALIKDCFRSIADRIKLLSQKSELNKDEESEIKYYKKILTYHEKELFKLFTLERYKLTDLYYRF
uniref:Uncharacterized protein n=1 Tax=viral metagenome TaxID=1070528 RepID=A0A6C0I148_9ZZZZ